MSKADGSIVHAGYRNPSNNNRHLNAISRRDPATKSSVLNILINRTNNVSYENSWKEEQQNLKSTLCSNGYSRREIIRAFKKQLS